MSGNRWLANARAAHTRAMGAPQAFPLLGDGEHTNRAMTRADMISGDDGGLAGAALAEARYRDWLAETRHGAIVTRAHASAVPPPLRLVPDDRAAVQTRLVMPPRALAADMGARLADAVALLQSLADEFGALFPEELAPTLAYLTKHYRT